MKTLSIQQPCATLICAGIKDIESRTLKAALDEDEYVEICGGKTPLVIPSLHKNLE